MNSNTVVFFIGVLIAVFVLVSTVSAVMNGQMQEDIKQSEQWCDERGGELINVQAVVDGGLHCRLENGTSIRMAEINYGETA